MDTWMKPPPKLAAVMFHSVCAGGCGKEPGFPNDIMLVVKEVGPPGSKKKQITLIWSCKKCT